MIDFLTGMKYALSGFKLIFLPSVKRYAFIPLLINLLIFSGAIYIAKQQLEQWIAGLLEQIPDWLAWLEWLIWPLFIVMTVLVIFFGFTIVANIIAAPFNSMLAEKIERRLSGKTIEESSLFKGLGKSFINEIRKVLYALKWMPVMIIITLIPGINFIAPLLWFIFGAWMLALQYSDYAMANHQLFIKEELQMLRQHRPKTLGFGTMLTLLMMIPVLNFLVIPVGVAGGTRLWVDSLSGTTI